MGVLRYNGGEGISIISKNNLYEIRFNRRNDAVFEYKMCAQCNGNLGEVSFLDKSNGRIYLVERDCYLEPLDRDKFFRDAYLE